MSSAFESFKSNTMCLSVRPSTRTGSKFTLSNKWDSGMLAATQPVQSDLRKGARNRWCHWRSGPIGNPTVLSVTYTA